MTFQKAVKRGARLRFAISGPAGSGKTFTLLRVATELTDHGRIAYIDTEHGSASKYAHTEDCGADCADESHFVFDVDEPASFDPRKLIEAIDQAAKCGYDALCIDSLSHYWMGPDGELEMVDNAAERSKSKNSFTAWKSVTPVHNALVQKMLSAPLHVLVAMRTKTEWVIEKDKDGKQVPRKIGLTPVMRDGIEYEFDVCGDIDIDNLFVVSKSRCAAISGKSFSRPGPELARTLQVWLGTPVAEQPRGDGEQQQSTAAESPRVIGPSPTQAAEEVPAPLRVLFEGLHKPGYVKQAFEIVKARMVELNPASGETEYRRLVREHEIASGAQLSQCKACLLAMWKLTEEWQAASEANRQASLGITDEDVPQAAEVAQ